MRISLGLLSQEMPFKFISLSLFRNRIIAVAVFLILAAIGLGAYYYSTHKHKVNYLTDVNSKAPLGHYKKFAISTDASECAPLAK